MRRLNLLSKEIADLFQSSTALYESFPDDIDGYVMGGCYTAAIGIKQAALQVSLPANLMVVHRPDNTVEHVIVGIKDIYIDADGVHSKSEMIDKIEKFSFRNNLSLSGAFESELDENEDLWRDNTKIAHIEKHVKDIFKKHLTPSNTNFTEPSF